ncbi:duf676 domain containing protein, hydrolase-like protein [Grosmannia clavigera kw1407]|uniref:Duf676 domain containing protein, hydrolase-like protein n=1 Tax=Grosmannia clavigera (strain kw1407 / UAMH 11150) TaxID=655863 RepID=F0XM47_GROCL|nr:duf676 domain containing protein, hydrolase-like protein [Grosmannia clavigera kw1407]EFX01434.1 duf676 domain containing protein, hydrolase-like protein [Grosmannia clavigera kw1407]
MADYEYTGGSTEANHLCVLVHGLWGNPGHMASIAEALRAKYPEDQLNLLVAKSNRGTFTYDGIETGGERVCTEIEEVLANVEARGGHITRLSVIGYSLGGLVARYAVGLLHAKGVLDTLECMNFTAFASPFLGARAPRLGVANKVWNTLGARILSMSGRQLFGIDAFRDTGRPLLAVLADPNSIFMAGLARFRRRTLYANIINDRSAVYYTTAIAKTDPYAAVRADGGELDDLSLQFVPGYERVILDRDEPIDWTKHHAMSAQLQLLHRKSKARWLLETVVASPWSKEARAALLDVAPVFALVLLLPIGLTAFLVHSAYETVRSRKRRERHENGLAGIDVVQYRVPLWMKSLQESAEGAYENQGMSAVEQQQHSSEVDHSDPTASKHEQTLALSPDQFAMIDALNALGWRKYPIWIHKMRHSHAAIIRRRPEPMYDEGNIVLKHYLEEEFLI